MTQQLPLDLLPQLVYGPDSFVVHDGVKDTLLHVEQAIKSQNFALFILVGEARSGKTHFALRIHALAARHKAFPRILAGSELARWLDEQKYRHLRSPDEPLVIDDVDQYLAARSPGQSGPFVAMVEYLRTLGATLVLTSSRDLFSLPLDDHILSRLRAGSTHLLGPPSENQLKEVLDKMALQRGFRFDGRKLEFLYRRVPRSIRELENYLENLHSLAFNTGERIHFSVLDDAL